MSKLCIICNNFDKSQYDEIFVVEGYMDAIALHSHNITNAVASLGTAFTAQQCRKVHAQYPPVSSRGRAELCFHNTF